VKLFELKRAIARSGCLAFLLAAGCALAATGGPNADGPGRDAHAWQDIESRIQYGYFTEDSHLLSNLQQQLAGADAADKLAGYYSAFLAYRLAQLSVRGGPGGGKNPPTEADKTQARELAGRCVASLDPVLAADKDFAEGLALQAACLGMTAEVGFWRSPMSGVRSGSEFKRALQLAPGNPRVLLLQAFSDAGHGNGDRAIEALRKALDSFEAERRDVGHVPAWGAAEAWELMGCIYLRRGEAVAARDALERSLLLAPGYLEARRLLLQITS
jgi:tetratricopeptide (TPR) repeat protein